METRTEESAEMKKQQPTVGRIVHYYGEHPLRAQAAIVLAVYPPDRLRCGPYVDLCVFGVNGLHFQRHVPYSKQPQVCHWTWPPKA